MEHWRAEHDPAPCLRVTPDYAVLADRKGGAHLLLIPTRSLSGIESPLLTEPGIPNYFAFAWEERDRLAVLAGRPLPRGVIGLAVNPVHARSQDQLHIHIECLRPDVARDLTRAGVAAPLRRGGWIQATVAGASFAILRLAGDDLRRYRPFVLLAEHVRAVGGSMEDYTLLLAGMRYDDDPGFLLLAGTSRAAELLLDSSCAAAGSSIDGRAGGR